MDLLRIDGDSGFRVRAGTERSQAAAMVLEPGEATGGPTNAHADSDQWLYVQSGEGSATVDGEDCALEPGALLLLEAGETHEIRCEGSEPLVTWSVYAPPEY
jgi:mannose-6-phosphate isomerase-like protein (cupin superfamily)